MSNVSIANVDLGSVFLESAETAFQPDELTVPATTVYQEGLILARDSSTGKLVVFVDGGSTNGNGIPKTVLSYDVENTTGGALDVPVRVAVTAKVRKQRLRIGAAATDDTGVTKAIGDLLRDFGIHPVNVNDLSVLDNQ